MIDCSHLDVAPVFMLIMWGQHSSTEIAKVIKDSLEIASVSTWEDPRHKSIESCGNYKDHSLSLSQRMVSPESRNFRRSERHLV